MTDHNIKGILSCGCIIFDNAAYTPCVKHNDFNIEEAVKHGDIKDEQVNYFLELCKGAFDDRP